MIANDRGLFAVLPASFGRDYVGSKREIDAFQSFEAVKCFLDVPFPVSRRMLNAELQAYSTTVVAFVRCIKSVR